MGSNDYSQRIGNLVAILEHYTCYKKIQKRRVIDLFFFEKICNHYLGSVRKKQINIVNKNLIKYWTILIIFIVIYSI